MAGMKLRHVDRALFTAVLSLAACTTPESQAPTEPQPSANRDRSHVEAPAVVQSATTPLAVSASAVPVATSDPLPTVPVGKPVQVVLYDGRGIAGCICYRGSGEEGSEKQDPA